MRICRSARYSFELSVTLEAALWIINVIVVFFATRYLFEMNNLAVYLFGWDTQWVPAFLGERHRFSGTLFGLGSDPVIGLGNISFPINPIWFPSYMLAVAPTGSIDGPLAF